MTLSLLMYALMGAALVALVVAVVFDARRSRSGADAGAGLVTRPPRDARRRVRPRGDCLQRADGDANGLATRRRGRDDADHRSSRRSRS
jgi:hypothetical protein